MAGSILIRGGRLIDPSQEIDETADLAIVDGRVAAIGKKAGRSADLIIEAGGKIVAPGLIDMHVHLREPGQEDKETIESGTFAASAGGFTAVACMPNTTPALDNESEIEFVLRQAERVGQCRVFPIGAITKARAGEELAEIGLMVKAGVTAFSDDGAGIADAGTCLRAMRYVAMFDKLFIQHCEDKSLSGDGCMNAGETATRLGLPGISALAEEVMVQRDILLAASAGARYHVAHVSTAGSVNMIRAAKRAGQNVTAEVCPHHVLLSEERCATYDTRFKMHPPLRAQRDVDACIEGVRDGTIDCLVTDHAPHADQDKQQEFQSAPFGITGLETSLGLFKRVLVDDGVIGWVRLIQMMSTRPAELLGLELGTLRAGSAADVTLIDPNREWTFDVEQSRSKGRNTPFDGWKMSGKAVLTMIGGRIAYRDGEFSVNL